ncbi:MAG: DUF4886 domain-containing protein [Ruminococcaceae bacterium]|nr:DUF4886 domain-containing protein [Oscillospiraceae bacterium]
MRVLCIGNSFSQDATRYLHQIARRGGVALNVSNLYIGGCPLARHFKNMHTGNAAYDLQFNGFSTGLSVSLEQMLLQNADWDYITVQQASHESIDYKTYQPYLDELVAYIRALCPKAKIVVHETWAYEDESVKLTEQMGYTKRGEMYADLHRAYTLAAEDIKADLVIPSGAVMEELAAAGIAPHRDSFHASLGVGRFALGLLWYAKLTGNGIDEIDGIDLDREETADTLATARACVKRVLAATAE